MSGQALRIAAWIALGLTFMVGTVWLVVFFEGTFSG